MNFFDVSNRLLSTGTANEDDILIHHPCLFEHFPRLGAAFNQDARYPIKMLPEHFPVEMSLNEQIRVFNSRE